MKTGNPNNCTNCVHSQELEQSGPQIAIGQRAYICRRFPPTPVLLPAGRNPHTGETVLTLASQYPPVGETHYCAEFRPHPDSDGFEESPSVLNDIDA